MQRCSTHGADGRAGTRRAAGRAGPAPRAAAPGADPHRHPACACRCNPLLPAYRAPDAPALRLAPRRRRCAGSSMPGGVGRDRPRRRRLRLRQRDAAPRACCCSRIAIADRLVTLRRVRGSSSPTAATGGPTLWLSDGWAAVQAQGWTRAAYWLAPTTRAAPTAGRCSACTACGRSTRRAGAHLSFYEAAAYARMGRRAPADRVRMGGRRRRAPGHRRRSTGACVAMDALVLRSLSGLPAAGRRGRRIQRQVHGRPDGAARRQRRHAAGPRAAELPQLLSAGRALAVPRPRLAQDPHADARHEPHAVREPRSRRPTRAGELRRDLVAGLRARPRSVSPKYFYDAAGSRLFDRICELPEYYPTRTETGASSTATRAEIARADRAAAPRSSSSAPASLRKVRLLLDALRRAARATCRSTSRASTCAARRARCARDYPGLAVHAAGGRLHAAALPLPARAARAASASAFSPARRSATSRPRRPLRFLRARGAGCCAAAALLLGVDLVKDPARAARRLQRRAGRDRGLQPEPAGARQPRARRRLRARRSSRTAPSTTRRCAAHRDAPGQPRARRRCAVAGERFEFDEGESLHTENSYKFTVEGLRALARARRASGRGRCGPTPRGLFSVHWLQRRGSAVPRESGAMKAIWNGTVIAESDDTVVVEGNHYFPAERAEARVRDLRATTSTSCAWKGEAQLLLAAGQRRAQPRRRLVLPGAEARRAEMVRDRVAFWKGVRVAE